MICASTSITTVLSRVYEKSAIFYAHFVLDPR